MKKLILHTTILFMLLMSGGKTPSVNELKLYKEIERLKLMDVTTRFIDNKTVELKQDWSGFQRIKSIKEPDETAIRAWIAADSIPFLEIDPTLIDTNRFTGWYNYWTTVPIFNGFGRLPLAGDIDKNLKIEDYGLYMDTTMFDPESHIYEIDTNGTVRFRYKYVPRRGAAMQFTDVDVNNLQEVVFQLGDSSYFYEQRNGISLPIDPKFVFAKYEYQGTAIFTNEKIAEMDNDSLIDFIYRGSIIDTTHPSGFQIYTLIAEYNPLILNFQRVWKTQLWYESAIGGYDVGDYDGDGQMNFLASGMNGQVWVGEATGNNQYAINWNDSLPGFINLLYQTSGDVDDDGKREFFVGATMGNGNWTVVYEADSNDHYLPTFLLHLLSGGSLDEPIYMTKDIDRDGKVELIIQSGGLLYIFKSSGDNFYQLYYFSENYDGVGVNFFDFNNDEKIDIIVSKFYVNNEGMAKTYSDIYLASGINDIVENNGNLPENIMLYQNYPNPFNPTTKMKYTLPFTADVSIKVYDLFGRKVTVLIDGKKEAGVYEVTWNAIDYPSGVYYARLNVSGGGGNTVRTVKLLLIK